MTEQTSANAALESLAEKLNALDLTDDERTTFGDLMGVEAEVEGFAKRIYVGNLPVIQGFNIGMPPTKSIDGDFGPAIRRLHVDGDFGPATNK